VRSSRSLAKVINDVTVIEVVGKAHKGMNEIVSKRFQILVFHVSGITPRISGKVRA
jgi:hypothetical protein